MPSPGPSGIKCKFSYVSGSEGSEDFITKDKTVKNATEVSI